MSGRFGDEGGESLIEIMITILVMAVGMVGIVGAIGSSIISSDAHRSLSQGEVVVRDFGEAIKKHAYEISDYVPCPDADQLDPDGTVIDAVNPALAGAGWTAEITQIAWWVPDQDDFPNGTWTPNNDPTDCEDYFDDCPDAGDDLAACDAGFQRITFELENSRTDYGKMVIEGRVLTRRNDAP
jgi:hypothetical protein